MRRLLLGSAALTAMTVAAFAADLPARGPAVAPAPVYVAPIFTWTGFYIGLNAGVGFNGGNNDGLRAVALTDDVGVVNQVNYWNTGLAGIRHDDDKAGFTGGAQIGYNWQFGGLVVGLEADINYLDRDSGGRSYTIEGSGNFARYDLDVTGGRGGSNWFGTIRPRIGFAFDRTMIYATGGLAYGGSRKSGAVVTLWDVSTTPDTEVGTWAGRRSNGSNWGWTLGAGIEHAFSNNWSLKLEYLYVDLDRGGNNDLIAVSGSAIRADQVVFRGGRSDDNFHVIRAGLNWRFGGPSYAAGGPVVARY